MTNEQLDVTTLLRAICSVLDAFDFSAASTAIERAAKESNNVQLLANIKQELTQLPPLSTINMNGEMRAVIQALIDSIKSATIIDKKFINRLINKFYHGFEPFPPNEIQRTALVQTQMIKEEVLGIEARHRTAHKLGAVQDDNDVIWQSNRNEDELHMTRELQSANY